MSIKVAVFNRKGGVGKTTISIILTQIALEKGKRVIAIDQDEQLNFKMSMENYMNHETKYRSLFTLDTVFKKEYINAPVDWVIVDCPPAFNGFSRFAIRNADLIVVPIRPDIYSFIPINRIRREAGDYKNWYQFPLVKIGFMEGNVHDKSMTARLVSKCILDKKLTVIGDVPLYASITGSLASGLGRRWDYKLQAAARQRFELIYMRLEFLYNRLQQGRQMHG